MTLGASASAHPRLLHAAWDLMGVLLAILVVITGSFVGIAPAIATPSTSSTYTYDGSGSVSRAQALAGLTPRGSPARSERVTPGLGGPPRSEVATGVAAETVVQVSRTAEGAADGSGISPSAARAAAERNGIDTRLMDLSYETGSPGQYGYTSFNGAGRLIRGASGRFQVTLTDLGLRSEADAVNTIAHELNHIREGMRTGGLPPSEGPAIWSGDTAELFFR